MISQQSTGSAKTDKGQKTTTSVTVMSFQGRSLVHYCDFEEGGSRSGFRKHIWTTGRDRNCFINNKLRGLSGISSKPPHRGFIWMINNKIKTWKPKLPMRSSWWRVLMSTGGEHGRGAAFRGTPLDNRDPLSSDSICATFDKSTI